MCLAEHLDERSGQATSTSRLQQSCRPSMAMGETSMAPHSVKGNPGTHFFLFFPVTIIAQSCSALLA